jgi:hypothetical protein
MHHKLPPKLSFYSIKIFCMQILATKLTRINERERERFGKHKLALRIDV